MRVRPASPQSLPQLYFIDSQFIYKVYTQTRLDGELNGCFRSRHSPLFNCTFASARAPNCESPQKLISHVIFDALLYYANLPHNCGRFRAAGAAMRDAVESELHYMAWLIAPYLGNY
jgi:hypothetical protein